MKNIDVFYSRYFIGAIILLFNNFIFNGCYSIKETSIDNNNSIEIYKVETVDGDTIDFTQSKLGYATLMADSVVCIMKNGDKKAYPISDLKTYYTEKLDTEKTVWTVIGATAVVFVIFIGLIALSLDGRGAGG